MSSSEGEMACGVSYIGHVSKKLVGGCGRRRGIEDTHDVHDGRCDVEQVTFSFVGCGLIRDAEQPRETIRQVPIKT